MDDFSSRNVSLREQQSQQHQQQYASMILPNSLDASGHIQQHLDLNKQDVVEYKSVPMGLQVII